MKTRRFTVRMLLIAIALAALATWGGILWTRSATFAQKAREHQGRRWFQEINLATLRLNAQRFDPEGEDAGNFQAQCARLERSLRYEDELYQKYDRAARFPWLTPTPDPAPPDP